MYQVGENSPLKLVFTDRDRSWTIRRVNLSLFQKPPWAEGIAVRAEVQ
jgi:hypothetical protein